MITQATSNNPVLPPDTRSSFRLEAARSEPTQSSHDYIEDVFTVSRNFNALADKLAKLQQTDPSRFQQVQHTVLLKLTSAAQESSGFRRTLLEKMAAAFAATGGNAPSITVLQSGDGAADIQATADHLLTHIFDAIL